MFALAIHGGAGVREKIEFKKNKEIASLMEYKRMSLEEAANHVILEELVEIGGSGGAVAMDKEGHIAMPYTSNGMYRGSVYENGNIVVQIFDE